MSGQAKYNLRSPSPTSTVKQNVNFIGNAIIHIFKIVYFSRNEYYSCASTSICDCSQVANKSRGQYHMYMSYGYRLRCDSDSDRDVTHLLLSHSSVAVMHCHINMYCSLDMCIATGVVSRILLSP